MELEDMRSLDCYKNIVRDGKKIVLEPSYKVTDGKVSAVRDASSPLYYCGDCLYLDTNSHCALRAYLEGEGYMHSKYPYYWQTYCECKETFPRLTILYGMHDLLNFMQNTIPHFISMRAFNDFYGTDIKFDAQSDLPTETLEEYFDRGGKLENCPDTNRFPCVAYFDIRNTGMYDDFTYISIKDAYAMLDVNSDFDFVHKHPSFPVKSLVNNLGGQDIFKIKRN